MSCLASALALASLFAGCGGSGGGDGNTDGSSAGGSANATTPVTQPAPGTATLGKVTGVVVASDSGSTLAAVKVQAANASTVTEADGSFTLENISIGQGAVVRFVREGYVDTFATANRASDKLANVVARMVPVAASTTFDNAAGTTLVDANSVARVVLRPASVVDAVTGKTPQGKVTMQIGVIDPASNSANMPGDYTTNTAAALESFGALSLQLRDAAGNKLVMAAGQTAAIRAPL